MIRDGVNAIAARKSEPYANRSFCDRCHGLDYTARLLVPFGPALHVCRSCRETLTGVPDTRNMRTPLEATARMTTEFAQLAPPPIEIRGLLMPGPPVHSDQCASTKGDILTEPEDGCSCYPPMPEMDPSRTPVLDDAAFAYVFGDDDEEDDLPDINEIEREIQKLEALDRELDAMEAELERQGR